MSRALKWDMIIFAFCSVKFFSSSNATMCIIWFEKGIFAKEISI